MFLIFKYHLKVCLAFFCATAAILFGGVAHAFTPEAGLWAINTEQTGQPGRGFKLDIQGSTVVITVYAYETDARPQWYLAVGALANNRVTASLEKYTGGTPLGATYRPATFVGSAGNLTLHFSSATAGVLTLPNERPQSVSRVNFARPAAPDSLEGAYVLERATVRYPSTGQLFETALNFAASGTMRISGVSLSQAMTFTLNGQTQSVAFSGSVTQDGGSFINVYNNNGVTSSLTLIKRGDELITLVVTAAFTEVDYWRRVSATPTASVAGRSLTTSAEHMKHDTGAVGAGLGALLMDQ